MRMRGMGRWFLVMLVGLAGCRARVATTPDVAPEDKTTHLSETVDISLEKWLKLPRPELAKLVEEWTVTTAQQREAARANPQSVQLLPGLHPPAVAVVFTEARYSNEAGFSLPPYLKAGQKDAAAALHLARFGDRAAALKLAEGTDKELLAKIDACRGERDYPLEWTRLVGLVLENAQGKLASGEADGAAELVQLHRQLRGVLDAKTAAGPLGAALLPRGKQALTLAAAAWREPRFNKTALASDIDTALADWGKLPDAVPALKAGEKQSEAARLFGTPVEGRAAIARTAPEVKRAFDLLALPLPSEGVSGVVAFFDDKQSVTELLVLYRAKINELFPEPSQLMLPLVERGYASQPASAAPGLSRQTWTGGDCTYEAALLTRGKVGGALVRIVKTGAASKASFAGDPRDFGAINLDRSFEQNRLRLAPEMAGNPLEIKDKSQLAKLAQPAKGFALESASLQCETEADLVARLRLRWPADRNSDALTQLALPLWAAYGPARFDSAEDENGGQFVLHWENGETRLKLSLPFDEQAPVLTAEDNRGASARKARVEAAEQFDRRERQERLAAGKPQTRLARLVRLTVHGIDEVRLGATREQVRGILPRTRSIRVQPLKDGYNVLFMKEPPAKTVYWPRQLFIRFDKQERVAEIRVRYLEKSQAAGASSPSLLDTLKAKPNGAPATLPAPWAGLWADLTTRKPPVLHRWQDDSTCLTYQKDKGGSEVVLRDCLDVGQLPPLQFCSRGVKACVLGDSQPDVRKRWHVAKPLLAANGAEVLAPPAKSPYDAVLVWYDNDKVTRVIARHREPKTLKTPEIGEALQKAWATNIDQLGCLRRQDGPSGQVLQAYSWNDDRTRVRVFAQETNDGVRMFTEWRTWPIPPRRVAAADAN